MKRYAEYVSKLTHLAVFQFMEKHESVTQEKEMLTHSTGTEN